MRIAILSDIHGNLPALEAVLEDIAKQAPDEVWCAGDIGFGGPWASDCIDVARSEGWPCVRGNTDVWITGDPQTVEDEATRAVLQGIAAQHHISEERERWLLSLPVGHSGPGSLLVVHARPDSPFDAPGVAGTPADFEPFMGQAKLLVYGHVHVAFSRLLVDGSVVCNAGSVGLPFDGPHATYLLVHLRGTDWSWTHRRVAFDRAAVEAAAERAGDPIRNDFLGFFRRGDE